MGGAPPALQGALQGAAQGLVFHHPLPRKTLPFRRYASPDWSISTLLPAHWLLSAEHPAVAKRRSAIWSPRKMAAEAALEELTVLLGPSAGAAVRAGAAEAALALSGDPEGRRLLAARPEALRALLGVAEASEPELGPAPGAALRCLQNASAEPEAREPLLAALPAVLRLLPAGPACGLLANLSRERGAAKRVLEGLERESGAGVEALLRALEGPRPAPELAALLCNLSGLREGRRALLERSRCVGVGAERSGAGLGWALRVPFPAVGAGARCGGCCRSWGTRRAP